MKEIKTLTLATLKNCSHCFTAKVLLKKYNIKYEELLWDEKENEELFDKLEIKTVPVLLIPVEDGIKKIAGEIEIGKYAKENED